MPETVAEAIALAVDGHGQGALHDRIYRALRDAILRGALGTGQRLPASRQLALQLGISRTTVVSAYALLAAEGYIVGRVGSGTRVAAELPEARLQAHPLAARPTTPGGPASGIVLSTACRRWQAQPNAPAGPVERGVRGRARAFPLGVPALDDAPLDAWARAIRRVASRELPALLELRDPAGHPPLRSAIAAHFTVARGVRCQPEHVVVLSSGQAAIDLAIRALLGPGDRVWVEEPGYLGIRGSLAGVGADAIPVPVDGEGLVVAEGVRRAPRARAAFVTPSNQFPLGVTMSVSRRLELLDWAERTGGVVLEDDYDSEYRYVDRPLPPLQSLDRAGRVVYAGTFSKALFPGIRIGFLVVPPPLVAPIVAARRFVDAMPSPFDQAALAEILSSGAFTRHLRRMRVLYARRADALLAAARRYATGLLELERPRAGLHAVAWLPAGAREPDVVAAAAQLGVDVRPLSLYRLEPGGRPGLVLGFGAVDEREIARGMQRLARAIEAARTPRAATRLRSCPERAARPT